MSSSSLATTYWYADSVTWGNPTANRYNLDNPYQVSSTEDYPNLVGKYTFRSATQTYTNSSVYYIVGVDSSTMYYIQLEDSTNHNLVDYNYTYTYGDSYIDNGNGTYTVTNQDESAPTTIHRSDWYTSYNNVGVGKYVCKNTTNDTCSNLWYTTEVDETYMRYIKVTNLYKYAQGFTYDEDTNTYTLNSDSVSFWNTIDSTNQTSLNTHHYTCWNQTGICSTLSYVFQIEGNRARPYYINLTNGKSIEDLKNEMLYNDDVNQINSTIKTYIDNWYQSNMTDYTSYLEDIIFCYNRSQSNASTNGWNPNGGRVTTAINFSFSSLKCSNEVDQFSVSNNKAKLTYPVGLPNYKEMDLLNIEVQKTGQEYWLGSPSNFTGLSARGRNITNAGSSNNPIISSSYGVRPVVSLKPGTEYSSGDGSCDNPYVVDTN